MITAVTTLAIILIGALTVASVDAKSILLNIIGIGFIIGLLFAAGLSQSSRIEYDFKEDSTVTLLIAMVGSVCAVTGTLFFFHQI